MILLSSVKVYYPPYKRDELINLLKSKVQKATNGMKIRLAILFGSYAKNCYTVSSDVDLLVVHEDDKDIYKILYKEIGIPNLQLHLYTTSDFIDMIKEKPRFLKELKQGVTIIGNIDEAIQHA